MTTPLLTPAGTQWAERHLHLSVARLAVRGRGTEHKIAAAICNQYAAGDYAENSLNRPTLASYRPRARFASTQAR